MDKKERILCVLNGGIPDRVPVTIFVTQEYLSYYYKKNNPSRVSDAVKLARELGFDVMTRQTEHIEPHYMRRSYRNWTVDRKVIIEGNVMKRLTRIQTPERELRQEEAAPYDPAFYKGTHYTTSKFLIEEAEDFECFKKYMPPVEKDYLDYIRDFSSWANQEVGQEGICCPWGTGSVFNAASTLRNTEDLLCDPYADEEFYADFMDFLAGLLERDYCILSDTDYECIGMQGNIANGKLVGNQYFEKYILPYEKRIIGAVRSKGKHVLYHNCGPARGLYEAYKKMGMTVWETVSPSPQGDNTFAEAKAQLGKHMVLSGNLDQIHFLKTATPQEVSAATRELMETGKPGGKYLFATSDYLEKDTPIENVQAMIRTAIDCGRY